jgi:hypothetical protein
MLLYAAAIFLGAFLLFLIEPMIAKAILPWFGGAAAVWTTCLLFFQGMLLGGYLYSDRLASFRSKPRNQALWHLALLWASVFLLPISPSQRWKPTAADDPTFRILGLLLATIGLPYLLLSTGPLLQAWYARQQPAAAPYRLFAVSNAGSLLGLLSYPILLEPFFTTRRQFQCWSVLYSGFVLLVTAAGVRYVRARNFEAASRAAGTAPPSWDVHLFWIAFPACSSLLLLAVTNHLSRNVAPIPFLWVLPLALYLLSFILCFEREAFYKRGWYLRLLLVAFAAMVCALSGLGEAVGLPALVAIFAGGLFVCCIVCHGELARLKPAAEHLTRYYILVAFGGAVGGAFVALIAPRIFCDNTELPAGLVLCLLLPSLILLRSTPLQRVLLVSIGVALAGVLYALLYSGAFRPESRLVARNFYGVLRVQDHLGSDPSRATRELRSGTINHGQQFLAPERRRRPTAYYGPTSGVGLALLHCRRDLPQRVGVIGLGAGVLASYARAGDYYRFYEINPLVVGLAHTHFTFLRDSPAPIDVVLGDGRLCLEREAAQNFDILAVDAFSGDAIPVHLLTREAFLVYFRHIKQNGILAVHISNRYLDLAPIVQLAVQAFGRRAIVIENRPDPEAAILRSTWVLAALQLEDLPQPAIRDVESHRPIPAGTRPWTDDYSNIFSILR